jgi:hypothetical protein
VVIAILIKDMLYLLQFGGDYDAVPSIGVLSWLHNPNIFDGSTIVIVFIILYLFTLFLFLFSTAAVNLAVLVLINLLVRWMIVCA